MRLTNDGNVFVFICDYPNRHIPQDANFVWNKRFRRWEATYWPFAHRLIEYAEESLRDELNALQRQQYTEVERSFATNSALPIPSPDGMEYYQYQKAGIEYAARRSHVLFGDEMGLGKTIQAVGVLNFIPAIEKVLVVCPASLKINWQRELGQWLVYDRTVHIHQTYKKPNPEADIIIVSYDSLPSKKSEWIHKIRFDAVIGDESHYIKNHKTARSKSFSKVAKKAHRVMLLTGTAINSRPIELWNQLKVLKVDIGYWYFVKRFCGAHETDFGWDMNGASNLAELQVMLRELVMVRRNKSDVLAELPAKTRQLVYLDPDNYKEYMDIEARYIKKNKLETVDFAEYDMTTRIFGHIADIATERKKLSIEKFRDIVDHINILRASTNKILVFGHHRDLLKMLHDNYIDNSVILMGGMSDGDKQEAVDRFQTDSSINLFFGSIKAAGTGYTLTAAPLVLFVEMVWEPASIIQAEDRVHRIGQTADNVLIQYLVIDGTIDANLAYTIAKKYDIINNALNKDYL